MKRRNFSSAFTLLVLPFAGCLNNGTGTGGKSWSPTIQGSEPELSPGEETQLVVKATDVAGVTLRLPLTEAVTINANDHDWSPPPDTVLDSYPQYWYWSSRSSVEGKFSLLVSEDAKSGKYSYGIQVFADHHSDAESVTEEFEIMVHQG